MGQGHDVGGGEVGVRDDVIKGVNDLRARS
jgi:hypothetical protein